MSSVSTFLRLVVPARSDQFSTQDIADNWGKIDSAPGVYICTSTSRPTWTAAQAGRLIIETDTGLEWRWTGTQFVRLHGTGLLKTSSGAWATASASAPATTSGTPVIAVPLPNVVVPAGNRPLRIDVEWGAVDNSTYAAYGHIFRSVVANSGTRDRDWSFIPGSTGPGTRAGGTMTARIPDGLAAGTYNWSFQFNSPNGGLTTLSTPTISVTEE